VTDAESSTNEGNRRSEPRLPVHLEVDCSSAGTGDTFLYAFITDISSMGIFIRTDEPQPVGTMLELGFTPPPDRKSELPPRRLELTGEVMWNTRGSETGAPGMGVRFHHTSPKTRQRLLEIVRAIAYLDGSETPAG
jgi:type IV pilus assembly protein PilZ